MSFSDQLQEHFALACGDNSENLHARIADRIVLFRFANRTLMEQIVPPFTHLLSPTEESKEATLTVLLWDAVSSGIALPDCPVELEEFADRGVMHGLLGTYGDGVFQYFDAQRALAVFFVADRVPQWARKCPLLHIFGWWAASQNMLLTHAGVVGKDGKGVLLLGKGGSGKSSTTLAAILSGFSLVSDDYVLLENFTSHSLYCTSSIEYEDAMKFQQLSDCKAPKGWKDRKLCLQLMPRFQEQLVSRLKLVAAVALRVSDQQPILRPLPKARALLALAPSTLLQATHPDQAALSTMSELLKKLDTYTLNLSRPVGNALAELETILD